MNTCTFTGNVASDPEVKGNGNVLAFRIAVDCRVYDAESDSYTDGCDFLPMVMFGKRAEAVGKFLKKGMPVTIQATAKQSTWTTDDGQNRSAIEFRVTDIVVGAKREKSAA